MIRKYKILFLIAMTVMSFATQSHAQDDVNDEPQVLPPVFKSVMPESEILPDVKLLGKTHPEKIVFTQIKLAKGTPNIDQFARNSPYVEQAQEIDKSAMILSEYNRIGNSYNLHDQNANIIVHAKLKTDEYSSLQDLIVFDELDDTTYFQYNMYGYNVGIVPEDVQKFGKLALSKARAENMFAAISSPGDDVIAEFMLKPVYADVTEPFEVNESNYWLMFARIAELRLWSNESPDNAQLLWYYRAPWYAPKDKSNINNLFVRE